jgi:hypothetical protein
MKLPPVPYRRHRCRNTIAFNSRNGLNWDPSSRSPDAERSVNALFHCMSGQTQNSTYINRRRFRHGRGWHADCTFPKRSSFEFLSLHPDTPIVCILQFARQHEIQAILVGACRCDHRFIRHSGSVGRKMISQAPPPLTCIRATDVLSSPEHPSPMGKACGNPLVVKKSGPCGVMAHMLHWIGAQTGCTANRNSFSIAGLHSSVHLLLRFRGSRHLVGRRIQRAGGSPAYAHLV